MKRQTDDNCINTISVTRSFGRFRRRLRRRLARTGARALAALVAWQTRRWERHAVRYLDDRMLKDLGISRADVQREAHKPFWMP